ncbi:hypothetical protein V1517DRAFT_370279 [Lipomyces orientalis]|uniref:Uncharacterized protein n=1 Tax=Lipomyces orientalis TaxID=1233043 RepID=A0ACC3TZF3_9ASCO
MPRDSRLVRKEAALDEPDDNFVLLLIQEALEKEKRQERDGINAFIKRQANPNGLKPNTDFLKRVVKNADFHNTALLKREAEDAATRLKVLNELERPSRSKSTSSLRPSSNWDWSGGSDEGRHRSSRRRQYNETDKRKHSSPSSSYLPGREERYNGVDGSTHSDSGESGRHVTKSSIRLSKRARDSGSDREDGYSSGSHRRLREHEDQWPNHGEAVEKNGHRHDESHRTSHCEEHRHTRHSSTLEREGSRHRHRENQSQTHIGQHSHSQRHRSESDRYIHRSMLHHSSGYRSKDRDEHRSSLRLNSKDCGDLMTKLIGNNNRNIRDANVPD